MEADHAAASSTSGLNAEGLQEHKAAARRAQNEELMEEEPKPSEDTETCSSDGEVASSSNTDLINLDGCSSTSDIVRLVMQKFRSSAELVEYIQRTNDGRLLGVLAFLMQRPRQKIPTWSTLQDACFLLKRSRRILVLTGAGVSVSAGIPDFRSENGIYARLRKEFPLPNPTCMFDKRYFERNPATFFSFAHELWPGNYEPTPCHKFISMLDQQGKLLRNYTQNIDTLEQRAGIKRVINCHGSFATATCVTCGRRVPGKEIEEEIQSQKVARCKHCWEDASPDEEPDFPAFGVMKPDIVFFGEALPGEFFSSLRQDQQEVDLLLVIGTSLKVAPVSEIITKMDENVPAILINREVVGQPHKFDIELLGQCDSVVAELCGMLGWNEGGFETTESEIVDRTPEALQVRVGDAPEEEDVSAVVDSGKIVRSKNSQYLFKGFSLASRTGPLGDIDGDSSDLAGDGEDESEWSGDEEDKPKPQPRSNPARSTRTAFQRPADDDDSDGSESGDEIIEEVSEEASESQDEIVEQVSETANESVDEVLEEDSLHAVDSVAASERTGDANRQTAEAHERAAGPSMPESAPKTVAQDPLEQGTMPAGAGTESSVLKRKLDAEEVIVTERPVCKVSRTEEDLALEGEPSLR